MTHSFDVSALGLRIRISFDSTVSDHFLERVNEAWSDAFLPSGGEPDAEVSVPGTGDEESLLERLSVDVTLHALRGRRGSMLMFHAAGIADPSGRVVAFVGPSGRGKTTLTRALARVYGYVSDETIAVGGGLEVYPYRKPLSLVREGQPKRQVAASSVGLQGLPEAPLRLAALVVLDRVEKRVRPRVERVALVDVLDEVVAQMSYLPELQRPLQHLVSVVSSLGGLMRLTYSEAAEVLPLVEAILAGEIALDETAPLQPMAQAPDVATSTIGIGIGDVTDAVGNESAVCVLSGRTLHVLAGIAPEIWRGAAAGLSRDEIREAVVERYGAPPDKGAAELVGSAIEELISIGLLVESGGQGAPRL